ncbi:MAG: N-acetylmuramoyl-L-alanine amidase [Aestuariivirgaceae bacterium]
MSRTQLEHHWHPSPNTGPRRGVEGPELLILHYTGMETAKAACAWLCNPASGVSCHYLVDEAGSITQMVDENLRAWHAGVGRWKSCDDVNSASIGIEIHNRGHDLGYTDFPASQIRAVIRLCRDIIARNAIAVENVLAHSDVAPLRKKDPGEKFPWNTLHEAGIGHWVAPVPLTTDKGLTLGDRGAAVAALVRNLSAYGYGIVPAEVFDSSIAAVVTAFQRHFRPSRVDGIADRSTVETLQELLTALPRAGA